MRLRALFVAIALAAASWLAGASPSVIDGWRGIALDTIATGATSYFYPTDMEADSSTVGLAYPAAGTISNFRFQVDAVPTGAGDSTVAIRKNDTSDELSIAFSTTGLKSNASSFSISAGDTLLTKAVAGGTGGSLSLAWQSFQYDPTDTSKTYTLLSSNSAGSTARAADGTTFVPVVGQRANAATESIVEYKVPIAGTVRYFQIKSGTLAATSGTSDFTLRKNGADQTPTVQFVHTDDNTRKVDSTNSFTVAADDLIAVKWVISGSGGGNANLEKVALWIESTANEFVLVTAQISGGQRMNVGATQYYGPSGILLAEGATQAQAEVVHSIAFTAKRLHVMSDAEVGTTGTHTVTVLDDAGSDTSIVASFTDGVTGWQHDNTNTAAFAAEDAISFEITMAAGGTNRDWNAIGIVCEVAAPGGGSMLLLAPPGKRGGKQR